MDANEMTDGWGTLDGFRMGAGYQENQSQDERVENFSPAAPPPGKRERG